MIIYFLCLSYHVTLDLPTMTPGASEGSSPGRDFGFVFLGTGVGAVGAGAAGFFMSKRKGKKKPINEGEVNCDEPKVTVGGDSNSAEVSVTFVCCSSSSPLSVGQVYKLYLYSFTPLLSQNNCDRL
ncbi:hypothetical protein JZ751_012906 [Albula glossodonta]|uniref:Uncharacterized protein n=1 Tax=Albula glossodonta TaxID=121402 RepID=A0A8T2N6E6_9TELE|nr:hypothetical protein JZ751_012906 [Albula glossodonta]